MTENTNEPAPPAGTDEAAQVELGEASGQEPGMEASPRDGERPDLDRRQRHIAVVRKPMGPAPRRTEAQDEAAHPASTEGPTDPIS